MRPDELLAIDVGAELATLCEAQLQGVWQIPAELVRLAVARGATSVSVDRVARGLRLRIEGRVAAPDEIRDIKTVFDDTAARADRQAAIGRVERRGLEALVWAAGAPRARFEVSTASDAAGIDLVARRGRVSVVVDGGRGGGGSTVMSWGCRGLSPHRAVAWLDTALRFSPIPVSIEGRPVGRGFPGGLYRMRIDRPLPCELAVTAAGDAPQLWLLRHGVLATRAVVPGYPPFSAALELAGVVPPSAGAEEMRAAANPHLGRIIDEATRMLLLLVERLPEMDDARRERVATLLLRFAMRGLGRRKILASPCLSAWRQGRRQMVSPDHLAAAARMRSGVLRAVRPSADRPATVGDNVVEASPEQRSLLGDLLGVRVELCPPSRGAGAGVRLAELAARWIRQIAGRFGRGPLPPDRLGADERRLVEAAASAGVQLALCAGAGHIRARGRTWLVGRDRPEARAAVHAVAEDSRWLYPALLVLVDDDLPDLDAVRKEWLTALDTKRAEDGLIGSGSWRASS